MNILLINQPLNNRGDEAAHKAFVRFLLKNFTDAKIKVLFFCAPDDSVNQFKVFDTSVSYVNLKRNRKGAYLIAKIGLITGLHFLWKLHPAIRPISGIYKEADYILCCPGGMCLGGFQNWWHLFLLYMAMKQKKTLGYFGRSIGPFPESTISQKCFKKLSTRILNYCSFISLRDSKSQKFADEIGLTRYISTVDSAFFDVPNVDIPHNVRCMLGENGYVVFVPNILIWHCNFKNKITKDFLIDFYISIIDVLLDKFVGKKIVMLPQTFNNSSTIDNDVNFFREIALKAPKNDIVVLDDVYSSDVQQTIISNSAFLVGGRYHSIVFAINNRVPFIALSYEHKMEGLLEFLGLKERMISVERIMDTGYEVLVKDFCTKLENDVSLNGPYNKTQDVLKLVSQEFLKQF